MRSLISAILLFSLLACATQSPVERLSDLGEPKLVSCHHLLSDFKREVRRQQVQDAQVVTTDAIPFLAFDRFSQSVLLDVKTQKDKEQWLTYTARLSKEQRHAEFRNLVANHSFTRLFSAKAKHTFDLNQLDSCADSLTQAAKNSSLRASKKDEFWDHIRSSAPPIPSDYEPWLRILGVYPVAARFAHSSILKEQARIKAGFDTAYARETDHSPASDRPPGEEKVITYQLLDDNDNRLNHATIQQWFAEAQTTSSLNWPQLSQQQIQRLTHYYAPDIRIDTLSDDDRPGTVGYFTTPQPEVATNRPAVYLGHSYTRFHQQILLQLHYSLWFPRRTPRRPVDPYAGPFDAILLRLTLNQQGEPLVLDSIHHCGCYHMVFNLNDALTFVETQPGTEVPIRRSVLLSETLPKDTQHLSVTLSHSEHMIKHVDWQYRQTNPDAEHLSAPAPVHLAPLAYHHLRSLPVPDSLIQTGSHKSLFDEKGWLLASERPEKSYLWPFGIPSPGMMRQWGHHATAFIGMRHFDDARMFESLLSYRHRNPTAFQTGLR